MLNTLSVMSHVEIETGFYPQLMNLSILWSFGGGPKAMGKTHRR
jgi:hypothetical protein